MNKTMMLLGAGFLQVPGIKIAKEMGLRLVVTDRDPHAPGLMLADIPRAIDLKDVEMTVQLAKEYDIDGVMSNVNDIGVPTAAIVAEELGLVGIKPNIARIATNKASMREIWSKKGVAIPNFRVVVSLEEAYDAAKDIGFPLILKPTDRSGARGVTKIDGRDEIRCTFESAIRCSFEKKALIEEFMEGSEHSVEAVSYEGKIHILGVSDKIKTSPPYRFDEGVIYPSSLAKDKEEEVRQLAVKAIDALGIDVGPTHTEICLTKEGPKIIESHARCGGGNITTHMIPEITGVNMMKEVIKIYLGLRPDLTPRFSKAAFLRFIVCPAGKVQNISGVERLKEKGWVIDFWMGVDVGEIVKVTTDGPGRAGHLIVVGNTREEAMKRAEEALNMVEIRVSS